MYIHYVHFAFTSGRYQLLAKAQLAAYDIASSCHNNVPCSSGSSSKLVVVFCCWKTHPNRYCFAVHLMCRSLRLWLRGRLLGGDRLYYARYATLRKILETAEARRAAKRKLNLVITRGPCRGARYTTCRSMINIRNKDR